MLDDDSVTVHLNLSDHQAQHLLSLFDRESVSAFLQAGEKGLQAFGEFQVGLLIGEMGLEGLHLGGGRVLPAGS